MDDPAAIARDSGFALSTVEVAAFEVCFDLYGEDRLLATFFYDGKPRNAFVDDPTAATDDPVGWCIQYSDELSQSDRVVRPFRCPARPAGPGDRPRLRHGAAATARHGMVGTAPRAQTLGRAQHGSRARSSANRNR